MYGHIRAMFVQQFRYGGADTPCSAGYECDFTVQRIRCCWRHE